MEPTKQPEDMDQERRAALEKARELLVEKHPILGQSKPLKIGIDKDLIALHPEISPEEIKRALGWIVVQDEYVKAVVEGAPRYNLAGEQVGVVRKKDGELAQGSMTKSPLERLGVRRRGVKKATIKVDRGDAFGEVNTRLLRATIPLANFETLLRINTNGKSSVWLKLKMPCGTEVAARLNAKSFRKAVDAYALVNGNASVVIAGEYHPAESEIKAAGIMVMPKTPKEAK